MKTKSMGIFSGGMLAGTALAAAVGCLSLWSPKLVVREPAVPGEAKLEYTPPPPPSFSVELLSKYIPILSTLIRPKVEKITDDIYVAMGYALGNVTMVITDEGLVLIDTTESEEAARKVLNDFRKITDKPIRYIIYTHFHPDHVRGTKVFYSEGVQIIATREFLNWINGQDPELGNQHFHRSLDFLGGVAEPDYAFPLPVQSPYLGGGRIPEILMPTITFEGNYSFTLGGKRFELFHTKGETEDHLAVWIPDEKALHVGDLYYPSIPCLTGLMLEARPVPGWINSLSRFIELKPDYLLLGHTKTLKGTDLIQEHLKNYREALKYMHDETVRAINAGKTVDEAVAQIKLPEPLADQPYLKGLYCRVDWVVRGLYHDYTGWYDGKGTSLNPLPPEYRSREIVALAGGADKILARAIELQKKGEYQLSAELCDIVIAANPKDKLAHIIKAYSLQYLAFGSNNLLCIGSYRSAYAVEMKAAANAQ